MKRSAPLVIDLQNITCILGGRTVLKNITWAVAPGQHWAVIGLNGCGKTTLLNMINGYITPSSGTMHVLGRRYGDYDSRRLRRSIGTVSSLLQED